MAVFAEFSIRAICAASSIQGSDGGISPLGESGQPVEVVPAHSDTIDSERFADQDRVSVDELVVALGELVPSISQSREVRADYEAFVEHHQLADSASLYLDYVRIKIAFEATRGGGWWRLKWDITNKSPRSTRIWEIWHDAEVDALAASASPSAIAECDELSALFAYLAHGLGVEDVGLYWPTGNHTVAVWTIHRVAKKRRRQLKKRSERAVRVVVPTSMIFLEADQSFDTEAFNPWTQKTIYDYRRKDVSGDFDIPAWLARFFVAQVQEHGHKSQAQLQEERNLRDRELTLD